MILGAHTKRRMLQRRWPRQRARWVSRRAESAPDIAAALKRSDAVAPGPKRILICGSLYLAGHVLGLQEGVEPQSN